jgi:hypothetical protein
MGRETGKKGMVSIDFQSQERSPPAEERATK